MQSLVKSFFICHKKTSMHSAWRLQRVKKTNPGMYEGAAAPSCVIRSRGFAPARAETCRCLWQMQAGEGPMRHRVHAACAAMNDNAEL